MIPKFSVKKPYTVLVAVIAIIVLGFVSFTRMTPELFPNINLPYVMVMTTYPGATPQEVESEVTIPLEEQLATLENLKEIQSQSGESYSMILMEYNSDANLDIISVDIRDKIDLASAGFDDTVQKPVIFRMNPNMIPITVAAVHREGMDVTELSTFVEETLIRQLDGIDGVASVSATGVVEGTVHVVLDPAKIEALNDRLQGQIAAKTNEAKSQVQSGISQAESGVAQVESGKEKLKEAQKTLVEQQQTIEPVLEQLVGLVAARDAAKAAGQGQASDRTQQTIYQLLEQLAPYSDELKAAGIDLEQLAKDADSAQEQLIIQTQQAIDQVVGQLAPYSDALKTVGIDLTLLTKDVESAQAQLTAFRKTMANSGDELSNQMSELTATDAYLKSTISQLQGTLATIDSQAGQAASVDLTTVLSAESISQIITAENFAMPAGYVSIDGGEAIVSVGEEFTDLSQIENLILVDLDMEGFGPIRISDVATVSYLDNSASVYGKINGQDGILLTFSKQSDSPTAVASENILETFDELEKKYEGLSFSVLSDQGEYIDIVIDGVLRNLLLGGTLAILILLLFLRDLKPTLITAVSIPVSLTFAVVLMYFSGVTLNIISLAGLAVGVGMLVDNSIVVIENMYRLRQAGYSMIRSAVSGASQVAGAITASTLTTIGVFFPIVFVQGITRDIFTDMALTVGYSLMASLIIALTVVPAMGSAILKKTNEKAWLSKDSKALKGFDRILGTALSHRLISLALALFLLVGAGFVVMQKGMEFMPAMATPEISADIYMPEGTTDEEAMAIADEIAEKTGELQGVETVGIIPASATGGIVGFDLGTGDMDMTHMTMYVLLKDDAISKNAEISRKISAFGQEKGCEMFVSGDMDMAAYMGGSDFVIDVFATNTKDLTKAAEQLEACLKEVPGIAETSDVSENTTDEVTVTVDKNKAMQQGMTVAQVYQALRSGLSSGQTATNITYEGGNRDIVIHGTSDYENRVQRDALETMTLTSQNPTTGESVKFKLTDVATISEGKSLASISRLNQERGIRVTATADKGENVTLLQEDVEDAVDKLDLPKDVRLVYAGQNEEIIEAMTDLLKMMILGFLLIYLIMVAQFQSLKAPFIIMFTVPLAFTGGFMALLITGELLSVVSMIGFIMLMGIVVNNGIVLIDYINQLRAEGYEKKEAIRTAAGVRMRPVLMTAITTVLGLLPLAFGIGEGSEMVQPVAVVCIGGLLYATAMTLVIIPVIYDLMHGEKFRRIEESELEIVTE